MHFYEDRQRHKSALTYAATQCTLAINRSIIPKSLRLSVLTSIHVNWFVMLDLIWTLYIQRIQPTVCKHFVQPVSLGHGVNFGSSSHTALLREVLKLATSFKEWKFETRCIERSFRFRQMQIYSVIVWSALLCIFELCVHMNDSPTRTC